MYCFLITVDTEPCKIYAFLVIQHYIKKAPDFDKSGASW